MRSRSAMAAYCFVIVAVTLLAQFEIVKTSLIRTDEGVASKSNIDSCNNRVCVPKCCGIDEYIIGPKTCVKHIFKNYTLDFSDMEVYDEERANKVSTVNKTLNLIPKKFTDMAFQNSSQIIPLLNGIKTYLTVNGHYYMEKPNYYDRWTRYESEKICIDYHVSKSAPYRKPKVRIYVDYKPKSSSKNHIGIYGNLISLIFLPLVFVVYLLLPDLRNLGGKILMAYVFSLFWAYLLLFIISVKRRPYTVCVGITLFDYYFFLSSFCWMNVMSYDIWSTFRIYTTRSPIHRRDRSKFLRYCLYAWGLPLCLTAFVAVMNWVPLQHLPWIITPLIAKTNCFFEDNSMFIYLHIPMLVLIFMNWTLFLITAFNVWRLNRGTQDLEYNSAGKSSVRRKQSDRLMVYVKLSVVMGLSWLFEVVSWLLNDLQFIWTLTDSYNALIGLAIFIIFVGKKEIFIKLKKRCMSLSSSMFKSPHSVNTAYNSNDNTKSDDQIDDVTVTSPVCMSPKGPREGRA